MSGLLQMRFVKKLALAILIYVMSYILLSFLSVNKSKSLRNFISNGETEEERVLSPQAEIQAPIFPHEPRDGRNNNNNDNDDDNNHNNDNINDYHGWNGSDKVGHFSEPIFIDEGQDVEKHDQEIFQMEERPEEKDSKTGGIPKSAMNLDGYKDALDDKADSKAAKKLRELGGVLVLRRPPEDFAAVVLPPFVNSMDENGLGAMGKAVYLDDSDFLLRDKEAFAFGWRSHSFNNYLSDQISINRPLPDSRSTMCKEKTVQDIENLPEVSVIIIFHNEAWSALLRSVSSVFLRSPKRLIREVILVDDFSTFDHLKRPLEKYYNDEPKVKIIRATRRQGLIRARLLGFAVSTAPVVVFLDSHIECFPGWLEPLLQRIHANSSTVVFPDIVSIDDSTLGVQVGPVQNRGGFNWHLAFVWDSLRHDPIHRRREDWEPIRSPTMPGGLFAISRSFFERLGTYDPELDHWGGENLELSFKAWMCGGSIELVPCSHVGHIFRRTTPIRWFRYIGRKNLLRVAEVWMDDYKNYFYEQIRFRMDDFGDVSKRKQLRASLSCHSFDWYLKTVYPEKKIPWKVKYVGNVIMRAGPKCLAHKTNRGAIFNSVHLESCGDSGKQFWTLDSDGILQSDDWLLCFETGELRTKMRCRQMGSQWLYKENKTLVHKTTGLCLTAESATSSVSLKDCTGFYLQTWEMSSRRTDIKFPNRKLLLQRD